MNGNKSKPRTLSLFSGYFKAKPVGMTQKQSTIFELETKRRKIKGKWLLLKGGAGRFTFEKYTPLWERQKWKKKEAKELLWKLSKRIGKSKLKRS